MGAGGLTVAGTRLVDAKFRDFLIIDISAVGQQQKREKSTSIDAMTHSTAVRGTGQL